MRFVKSAVEQLTINIIIIVMILVNIEGVERRNVSTLSDLKNYCINDRFRDGYVCEQSIVFDRSMAALRNFTDFKQPAQIRLYVTSLVLLNNLNFYKPFKTAEFIESMVDKCASLALIDHNVTDAMQNEGGELFRWTADSYYRYHSQNSTIFLNQFDKIVDFFNTFVLWSNTDIYIFSTILNQYQRLRTQFVRSHDERVVNRINEAAVQTVRLALEYPLYFVPHDAIKENVFISYVNKMPNATEPFRGMYTILYMDRLMVSVVNYTCGNMTFKIRQSWNMKENYSSNYMESIDAVVGNFRSFYDGLKLFAYAPVPSIVDVFVHKDKSFYIRYAPLWSVPTNNGGYTSMDYLSKHIHVHVFFDDRDRKLPRNFGHEIHHSVLYATDNVDAMPDWFVEGSANAFGNLDCFEEDHAQFKAHVNCTIRSVVEADYASDLLYPMGHALVRFLGEQRSDLLRKMVVSKNYTFPITDDMQQDFTRYIEDRITFCNYMKRNVSPKPQESTQQKYVNELRTNALMVFKPPCSNYIDVQFNDCHFVLTAKRLIKISRDPRNSAVNVDDEIRFNYNTISQFDYDWFISGAMYNVLVDAIVRRAGAFNEPATVLVKKYLMPNLNYDYEANVTCDNERFDAISNLKNFVLSLDLEKKLPVLKRFQYRRPPPKNSDLLSKVLSNLSTKLEVCEYLIKPIVVRLNDRHLNDLDATFFEITGNISKRLPVTRWVLNPDHLNVPIDSASNTLLHWAALYDTSLYEYSVDSILGKSNRHEKINYYGLTPSALSKYRALYSQRFGSQSHYCFSYLHPAERSQITTSASIPISVLTDANVVRVENNFNNDDKAIASTGSANHHATTTCPNCATIIEKRVIVCASNESDGEGNEKKSSVIDANIIIYLCIIITLFFFIICIIIVIISIILCTINSGKQNKNTLHDNRHKNKTYNRVNYE
ncbi:ORF120 [Alphabaculovirus altermyunipunctae]|uniref:ORF120 n=1 Tax=Mythimna unipuncta nucleopolyhedrovirus TaxID=447897 RepID=A0A346TPQ6_9ABAC|nr:ORF120 [Mythimna unipuncta nucleopolyhedrovirus]AXU41566.1 ORF120 [Mythimna unipuncta nucleopolyhedrovirus]